jgi:hypothetical protein
MPCATHAQFRFQNLAHCLRSASNLQSLSLSFTGQRKIDIERLFLTFEDSRHTFAHLQEVKFEGVRCTENVLVAFLMRHKGSLRKVQLGGVGTKAPHQKASGGVHLGEGTWRSVFKRVHEGLHLGPKCFVVQGDMVDADTKFLLEDLKAVEELREFVSD